MESNPRMGNSTSMTPDELWEKYSTPGITGVMYESQFLAALAEYGAAVRARDVEICRDRANFFGDVPDSALIPLHKREREAYRDCAAAIAREPL